MSKKIFDFDDLINSLYLGIIVVDKKYKINFINKETLLQDRGIHGE